MKSLAVVLLAGSLAGCRGDGQNAAPDGREFPHVTDAIDRHAPSVQALEGFTYTLPDLGAVALTGGIWRSAEAPGETASEIELAKDFRLTGDLTGNGTDEAVVELTLRHPPAPERTYLAVVGWIGGQLLTLASAPVDERVRVKSGRIEGRRIVLEGVQVPADASAVPQPALLMYQLDGNTLRLIHGGSAAAPVSPAGSRSPGAPGSS